MSVTAWEKKEVVVTFYEALNRKIGVVDASGTVTTFDYDANGNLIRKTVDGVNQTYEYDAENRLIAVKTHDQSTIATYYYDPFGRRLWKTVDGTRTYFLYSDEGLIGEYDENGDEIRSYGYTPGTQWKRMGDVFK